MYYPVYSNEKPEEGNSNSISMAEARINMRKSTERQEEVKTFNRNSSLHMPVAEMLCPKYLCENSYGGTTRSGGDMEGLDLRWGRFVLKTCDFIGLISTCAQASEVGSQTNEDLNVGLVRAWRHVLRGNDVRLCVEGGKMQFIPACRNEGVQESGCDEDSQLEAMRAELLSVVGDNAVTVESVVKEVYPQLPSSMCDLQVKARQRAYKNAVHYVFDGNQKDVAGLSQKDVAGLQDRLVSTAAAAGGASADGGCEDPHAAEAEGAQHASVRSGQSIHDFHRLPEARAAGLSLAEVGALRLYTTQVRELINIPLSLQAAKAQKYMRDQRTGQETVLLEGTKIPKTIAHLLAAIDKMRQHQKLKSAARSAPLYLYRSISFENIGTHVGAGGGRDTRGERGGDWQRLHLTAEEKRRVEKEFVCAGGARAGGECGWVEGTFGSFSSHTKVVRE